MTKLPLCQYDGNIIYVNIDGVQVPSIAGEIAGYNEPVIFFANIAMSGGEAETKEYGVNISDYEAIIITTQMDLPISETSIIWWDSSPKYNTDGVVDRDSADFEVISARKSLNFIKYLLRRIQK